ncbi:MAG: biotin synthase BioB [Desulfomonilia bacterium]
MSILRTIRTLHNRRSEVYPIISFESALRAAVIAESHGIQRFALVTSGKKTKRSGILKILEIIHGLRRTVKIDLCASLGALTRERAEELKKAGITRYHHNVETSSDYFPQICTTHTYLDRIETIRTVIAAGIEPCCGGIIGLGESMEQRIRLAFEIKAMGVKSIPLTSLILFRAPLWNTCPDLHRDEILRTIAMFRLIIPDSELRYAVVAVLWGDKQRLGLIAGISSVMVGNFLTTAGNDISQDLAHD